MDLTFGFPIRSVKKKPQNQSTTNKPNPQSVLLTFLFKDKLR